jgi:preprotein translocase subunit SecF
MKSRDDFGNVINVSINEVLSRTIVTASPRLLVLPHHDLGGGALRFRLWPVLGLIVGTYSSIFVASPIVYAWRQKFR